MIVCVFCLSQWSGDLCGVRPAKGVEGGERRHCKCVIPSLTVKLIEFDTAICVYALIFFMLCSLIVLSWLVCGQVEVNVGSGVCRMRQNKCQRSRVATGGKENPLKVWDLERPEKPVFTAKNVSALHIETLKRYDGSA